MTEQRRPIFRLKFYSDSSGSQPVLDWLRAGLSPSDRRTVGAALFHILQQQGIDVCGTTFGRQLGGGLFEFRLREAHLLVRIFCHAYSDRVILLLSGYDKRTNPSERRQNREIALARSRLQEWLGRRR